MNETNLIEIPEPKLSRMLFADTRMAWLWLIVRLYVGWQWLHAGWEKIQNPNWVGSHAGTALLGFLNASLQKTGGLNPDVSGWYAAFLRHVAIPHVWSFSYLVSGGETLVGLCLILGLFTGIAGFFGAFMNLNYMFAGALSINPLLFLCELFIILAWRTAGWYGLDRFVLPALGTPWQKGRMFNQQQGRG